MIRKYIYKLFSKRRRQSNTCFTSIHDFPLDKFIACICDNNFSLLIKPNQKATEKEMQEAWNNIYSEYAYEVQDKEQKYISGIVKSCHVLSLKIALINLIVNRLSTKFDSEILNVLKMVVPFISGTFDENNQAQYTKDLQMAITVSKKFVIELEDKQKQLDALIPKNSKSIDRSHFDKIIVRISQHFKFQIDRAKTTVGEFTAMIMDMRETVESINKLNKK